MTQRPHLRICLAALLLASASLLQAQDFPLTVTPTVLPPYTASYVQYFQNPGQISVNITNNEPGAIPREIYLAGSITTTDENISVRIEGGQAWNADPLEIPMGGAVFDGTQLEPFVSNSGGQLQFLGISEEDIRLGLLPEGEYHLCLQAFDYLTNEPLSRGEPDAGCSFPFTITYPPPPQLLNPLCGGIEEGTQPQTILFNWILPSGPPIGAMIQYHFKLVLLPEDENTIDPLSALETSNDPVWEDDVMIPQVLYTQLMPALIPGRRYAWYVRAVDANAQHLFQNNGWSEPCTFEWQIGQTSTFEFAYPAMLDTIPWDLVPVMVHFEPHNGGLQTGRFHSTLTLHKDGVQHSITERKPGDEDILWNSGPYASQRYLLNEAFEPDPPFTQEQAHYINMYRNDALGDGLFKRGSTYTALAQVRINTYNEATPIEGQIDGAFVSGMGRPRPIEPVNNSTLPRNTEEGESGYTQVSLRFKTSEAPEALMPPFPIWMIPETGPPTQTLANISERWYLQVARDVAFTDIVHTANDLLGTGLQLNSTTCNASCVESALYKEETVAFTPNADGIYFWRVRWMKDPTSTNGETYHDGPTWKFTIGDVEEEEEGGGGTAEEEEIPPAQCLAESRRSPTPAAQRVSVNTTQVGDTVQVGLFKMKVSTISHSGDLASGVGLIDVPVMRAQLRVQFSGANINAQKRMYTGDVTGLYDNAGVIPPAWIQGTSLASGFNPQAAQDLDEYLNTAGRLVSQFGGSAPMGLPIGIDKQTEAGRIVIGILGIQFTDTIARLNAGMALPMNELGETVGLGNMAIPFHPGGIGDVYDEATLYLLGDLNIPLGADTLKFKGARFAGGFTTVQDSGTFVAWDCQGFRAVTFDLEYRFDREKLREDLPNGEDGPQKVIGSLRVRTGRAGIMGRLDLNTPFHLTHAKGWGFDVQEAWLDLASYVNPTNISLPAHHLLNSEHFDPSGSLDPAWTGVYVKRAMLRLPNTIQRFEGAGRTTAQVDNLVYGFGEGLSASFKIANILDTDEGTLDGWGFSLDTLQADIALNSFVQGGFKGRIHVPFSDTLLAYSGMIQHQPTTHDLRMEFLLHPDGTLNVPMYIGQIELLETSTVRAIFGDANTGNSATAELNGKLSIDVDMPASLKMNFRDIAFQHLTFSTEEPYTNIDQSGVFSLASPQKYMGGSGDVDDDDPPGPTTTPSAGGFPVSITRVTTERRNSEGGVMAGIGFDINLDLSGSTNIFVATTRIAVLGQLNTTALHEWGHHSVELDSIGITGETGAVKIIGGVRWYHDDPTYGNGMNGAVRAWFMKGALEVSAAAQFGNVNGTRYWFADAMIAKDNGFSPGSAFNVYGFGGGAWYHMERMSDPPSSLQITQATLANQNDDTYTPGLTLSNVVYRPKASELFGFKATVIFGDGASGRAYNGELTAGMTLSESGGVSTAFLTGKVYLMRERSTDQQAYAPIWGDGTITFDFPNDRFTANFNMYVKLHGGMLVGTGPGEKAGSLELLIDPDTWHLFVGTPQTPIGLNFRGLFEASAYFMAGQDLPAALLPDSAAVLALLPPGYFVRSDVSNASGIAFGARAVLDQDFDFYLLRMSLDAGLGFDLAFTPADELECLDNDDPGIAGFYATGQVYAYLSGSVSLHIDVWFAEGDYEIMSMAAAAMLEGGFADPTYVKGAVGGQYSILGGLVDGSFTFPFEAGEPCEAFGGSALAGLDPIGDITPHHGRGITLLPAVSCGVTPEVVLNMKLNTPFQLKEIQENGTPKWHTYRLILDDLILKKGSTEWNGTTEIAASKDQVLLLPNEALAANSTYKFTVKLRVEKQDAVTNNWATANNGEEAALWDSTVTFKTGAGIKVLTTDLLDYTYPFVGQRYLLQDECRNGIIQCKQQLNGPDHLFDVSALPANKVRVYKMMITPHSGGTSITTNADVDHGGGKTWIHFAIPQLQNGRQYVMQFISRDSTVQSGGLGQQTSAAFDMSTMSMSYASTTSYHGGMANIHQRRLSGYSVRGNEKLLFTYHFATSAYSTITAKAAALTAIAVEHTKTTEVPPRETVSPSFSGEKFDVFDVNGYQYRPAPECFIPPMIKLDDARTDTWNNNWAKPLIYDYYAGIKQRGCSNLDLARSVTFNSFGVPITQDSPDHIGIPPVHTVSFHQYNPVRGALTESETAPPQPWGNQTAGMGIGMAGDVGGPQTAVRVNVRTGTQTRSDYLRMETISADAMSHCGHLDPVAELGMEEPLRSKAVAFENSTFKLLYRTNYGAKFLFSPPPSCQPFSDWNADAPPLNSGNATYYLSTGIPPSNTPAGAGIPSGGAIKIRP